jgi:hypothetical protein
VRPLERQHVRARLSDTAADAEWKFVVDDSLVIGKLEEMKLTGPFQLRLQCLGVDSNVH